MGFRNSEEAKREKDGIIYFVRKTFENADARNVFEHVAIQINVVGEGEGIFYFEVAASRRNINGSYCLRTVFGRVSIIKSSSSRKSLSLPLTGM